MEPVRHEREPHSGAGRLDAALRGGHYARKQIFLKNRLIAWSHRRRFQVGLDIVSRLRPRRVLDYGCGDGTFLAMLLGACPELACAVGAEVTESVITDCRRRFAGFEALRFVHVRELGAEEHVGAYDAVFCMEVLEHMVEPHLELARLRRLIAPSGRLCLSVPVETGVSLAIKQCARRMAALRGMGDYPGSNPYTWGEFFRSVFASSTQHIDRPIHKDPSGVRTHDHKGFNWRVLLAVVAEHFEIEAVVTSPLRWLPTWAASQVWMGCRLQEGKD